MRIQWDVAVFISVPHTLTHCRDNDIQKTDWHNTALYSCKKNEKYLGELLWRNFYDLLSEKKQMQRNIIYKYKTFIIRPKIRKKYVIIYTHKYIYTCISFTYAHIYSYITNLLSFEKQNIRRIKKILMKMIPLRGKWKWGGK